MNEAIEAVATPETALAYLEAKQKDCKHEQPLLKSMTGHQVCRLCWKTWQN